MSHVQKKTPVAKKPGIQADWRLKEQRYLVTYKNHYTFFVTRWDKARTPSGSVIEDRQDIPVRLVSHSGGPKSLLGYVDYEQPVTKPKYDPQVPENMLPDRPAYLNQAPHVEYQFEEPKAEARRIPLWGSGLMVDKELAEECGLGFEELVEFITNLKSYGRHVAFIDDTEALQGMVPRFSSFVAEQKRDMGHLHDALEMNAHNQIGPPLAQLEPESAP